MPVNKDEMCDLEKNYISFLESPTGKRFKKLLTNAKKDDEEEYKTLCTLIKKIIIQVEKDTLKGDYKSYATLLTREMVVQAGPIYSRPLWVSDDAKKAFEILYLYGEVKFDASEDSTWLKYANYYRNLQVISKGQVAPEQPQDIEVAPSCVVFPFKWF